MKIVKLNGLSQWSLLSSDALRFDGPATVQLDLLSSGGVVTLTGDGPDGEISLEVPISEATSLQFSVQGNVTVGVLDGSRPIFYRSKNPLAERPVPPAKPSLAVVHTQIITKAQLTPAEQAMKAAEGRANALLRQTMALEHRAKAAIAAASAPKPEPAPDAKGEANVEA